jgi:SusD family.
MAVMSGRGSEHMTYTNMPVIRYAEVLLLAAEAQLLGGSPAKADQYVNQVRQRAKLGAKTGVTLQDIQTEKNLELCFEGVRYLDIIRWGIAYDLMKDQGKETYNLKVTKDGPNYTYERVVSDTNPNAGSSRARRTPAHPEG